MTYQRCQGERIDYRPCTYGASRLAFRGPRKDLDGRYVAFLGSTETFGKFVRTPFPEIAGRSLGVTAVNLGCVNAGLDTFRADGTVRGICRGAAACVVQAMGAQKLSNPYYSVHGRRNDRVLAPTPRLAALYPEVDFSEIHFARHLVATLARCGPDRFAQVREALRAAWSARMAALIAGAGVPVVLLWLTEAEGPIAPGGPVEAAPLYVDRGMIGGLDPAPAAVVRVAMQRSIDDPAARGMVFAPLEEPAARELPGPAAHRRIAEAVCGALARVL